jgi:hypothetical protein
VVIYVELDPSSSDLSSQITRRSAELASAGVDSVIFQFPGDHPDPTPLVEALRARG